MTLSLINIFLLLMPLNLSIAKKCIFTTKFQVHVINKLPSDSPQLRIHCASGDNDLGYHCPAINEDFNWSFCEAFFDNTLFFCHCRTAFHDWKFILLNNSYRSFFNLYNCIHHWCNKLLHKLTYYINDHFQVVELKNQAKHWPDFYVCHQCFQLFMRNKWLLITTIGYPTSKQAKMEWLISRLRLSVQTCCYSTVVTKYIFFNQILL